MSKQSFGIVCALMAVLWGAPDARAITAPGHTVTEIVLPDFAQGDVVVVESRTTWYTYEVDDGYIVPPTQVEVVAPVPNQPDAEPTEALITLTTCNPRWASYERLIFHGRLVEERPKSDGPPAALRG